MADLKQALLWLADGKKIRGNKWDEDMFIELKENAVRWEDGYVYAIDETDSQIDWDLFKDSTQIIEELKAEIESLKQDLKQAEHQLSRTLDFNFELMREVNNFRQLYRLGNYGRY